jgi:predicted RNase H-like HicB family nuclease
MRYAIVIEKAVNNYSAYVPDLLGCVATGATVEEAEAQIRGAIEFHLDGMVRLLAEIDQGTAGRYLWVKSLQVVD